MTHGHLSATVKGYARSRRDALRRRLGQLPRMSGRANVAGWKKLEALTADMASRSGVGPAPMLQYGGERLVG